MGAYFVRAAAMPVLGDHPGTPGSFGQLLDTTDNEVTRVGQTRSTDDVGYYAALDLSIEMM